jgi:hypothetical protein
MAIALVISITLNILQANRNTDIGHELEKSNNRCQAAVNYINGLEPKSK